MKGTSQPKPKSLNTFRKVADLTFPLYILHFPLLVVVKSLLKVQLSTTMHFVVCMLIVVILVSVIGTYLEAKRPWWNQLFGNLLIRIRKTTNVSVSKATV
ncbi:hypothetical protein ABDD95_04950 [Mucilaginibacter sp. PAMB04274]|uniref:hypothetical protein n=1 Tax=Mucilaginibacter sp. PAMB04274 TaxID=3138568 RepID=UPI0031F674F1